MFRITGEERAELIRACEVNGASPGQAERTVDDMMATLSRTYQRAWVEGCKSGTDHPWIEGMGR